MRYIQDSVANHTGLVPRADIDPIKAVAYGAAYAALIELNRQGRRFGPDSQILPHTDSFVRDVTGHAVGCCVADNNGTGRRLLQAVIIPKNTPIPCRKADRFYLERDDQTEARIEILQGDAGASRDDCLLIGEVVLDNLPIEKMRSNRILVEYIVDSNGMITATATDTVSSAQQTVSVDYKRGVQPKPKPASI
jgi:molecular chaperone DnaK (HSP70)